MLNLPAWTHSGAVIDVAVFAIACQGMIPGGLPRAHLARTRVALLGAIAIAIIGLGELTPKRAAQSIHLPTVLLLFSFMAISVPRPGGSSWSTERGGFEWPCERF